jgi:uncharacterized membrane protein YphA (DoxX/SURF4 family)
MADAAAALVEFPAVETPRSAVAVRPWSLAGRLAFRFLSVYFAIYVVTTQMLGALVPLVNFPPLSYGGPVRWMVEWTAAQVFDITAPLVVTGSGSGDKTFDWIQAFCFLVIAAVATAAWSAASRTITYDTAHKWYRLFLRFALGATLLSYGAMKLIPLQMPFPSLQRLLEPYGDFSPMGVLWASIGASRPYEIFTGSAEVTAGILLFVPMTTTLGALVSLAVTLEIFILNMTYDVPVKLFSFHLILMSLFLLAPETRRLMNVLVLNRPADRSPVTALGGSKQAIRAGTLLQVAFGLILLVSNLNQAVKSWSLYGGGAPKSPLYGIWSVAYLSIDGVERAPLVTDYDRWRHVIFDAPARMAFQRMDQTFAGFNAAIDMTARSLTLTRPGETSGYASFSFEQAAHDRLTMAGVMDGRKVEMQLELIPREKFLLVTRGFSWVQEYPFNR